MSRTLNFTVDREPVDLVIGGEKLTAPPILAPESIAQLLDMQQQISQALTRTQELVQTGEAESTAMREALNTIASVYDLILDPETDSAARFRARLFSRSNPLDLVREVMPATVALVELYTGRPTEPSPPSSTSPGGDGMSSTAGQQPEALTLPPSPPAGSAISSTTG